MKSFYLVLIPLLICCTSVPKDTNIDECFSNIKRVCGSETLSLDMPKDRETRKFLALCRLREMSTCIDKYKVKK